MKDKFGLTKIENPYKVFLRNIQIGLILVLLIFGSIFAGPVIFKNIESNVSAASYKTITLNKSGGTGGTSTIYSDGSKFSLTKGGSAITKIIVPTKTGYTFNGYKNSLNQIKINSSGTITGKAKDVSFNNTWTAQWTANSSSGGSSGGSTGGSTGSTTEYKHVITLNLDDDGDSSEKVTKKLYVTSTNYCIDEDCSKSLIRDTTANSNKTSPIVLPKKEGHTFLGYYGYNDENKLVKYINANGKLSNNAPWAANIKSNQIWYAQWEPKTYIINIYVSTPTESNILYSTKTYTFSTRSQQIGLSTPEDATEDGYSYVFDRWTSCTNARLSGDYLIIPASNTGTINVYGSYKEQEYNVKIYTDTSSYTTKTVAYSDQLQVSVPSKSGYKFMGWTGSGYLSSDASYYLSANGSWKSWDGSLISTTATIWFSKLCSYKGGYITITANWSPIYTIAFKGYDDENKEELTSFSKASVTKIYGEGNYDGSEYAYNLGSPTLEGYNFVGWSSSSSDGLNTSTALRWTGNSYINWTGSTFANGSGGNVVIDLRSTSGTVTVTAHFTPITYNVSVDYRNSDENSNYNVKYGKVFTISKPSVGAGITFKGWKLTASVGTTSECFKNAQYGASESSLQKWNVSNLCTSSSNNTYFKNLTTEQNMDITLTAQYSPNVYYSTLQYNSNKLEISAATQADVVSQIGTSFEGKTVLGVFDNDNFTAGSIIGVPTASQNVNISGYENVYVLLKGNITGYTTKINFSSVQFKLKDDATGYEANSSLSIIEDKKTTIFTIGTKNDFSECIDFKGNTVVENLKKKIEIGYGYLNASNIYFFMDRNNSLWAWDGENSIKTETSLTTRNSTTYSSQLFVEFESTDFEIYNKTDLLCYAQLSNLGGLYEIGRNVGYTLTLKNNIDNNNLPSTLPTGFENWTVVEDTQITNDSIYKEYQNEKGEADVGIGFGYRFEFTGTFNGNGYKIGTLNSPLFRVANGAKIHNLEIGTINISRQSYTITVYMASGIPQVSTIEYNFLLIGIAKNTQVLDIKVGNISGTYTQNYGYYAKAISKMTSWVGLDSSFAETNNLGLIGYAMDGSNISNCVVNNFNATFNESDLENFWTAEDTSYSVGGIVGKLSGGSVSECSVGSFTYSGGGKYCQIGGIVGKNISGTIEKCKIENKLTVSTNCTGANQNYVGGLVGNNNGNINGCQILTTKMNVTMLRSATTNNCAFYVGGLVGGNFGGKISSSFNLADIQIDGISGKTAYAGGLVGTYGASNTIEQSFSTAKISNSISTACLGGLVGRILSGSLNINACYSISGFSYSSGTCGSMIGYNYNANVTIKNSYYTTSYNLVGDGNATTSGVVLGIDNSLNNVKDFVQNVNDNGNNGKALFGFARDYQNGYPYLVGVGNATKVYKIYNCKADNVELKTEDDIYWSEKNECYVGFGVYNGITSELNGNTKIVSTSNLNFKLPLVSTTDNKKTFLGFGQGTSANTVCTAPSLFKDDFTESNQTSTNGYLKDGFVSLKQDDFSGATIELSAVFSEAITIVSNLNLISASDFTTELYAKDQGKSIIFEEKDGSETTNKFSLEFVKKENGNYVYVFANLMSAKKPTYNDLYNSLKNYGRKTLNDYDLNIAISTTNVFASGYSFDFDQNFNNYKLNTSTTFNTNTNYYVFAYSDYISLYYINVNKDSETGAIVNWGYADSCVETGRLVYGIKTQFSSYGVERELETSDFKIERKGFVLDIVSGNIAQRSATKNADATSSKDYYTLNENKLDSLKGKLFAVYNIGPHLEINYYDENEKYLYTESIPAVEKVAKFSNATLIKNDEVNFAGWWLKDATTNKKLTRFNESTIYNLKEESEIVNLYKSLVISSTNSNLTKKQVEQLVEQLESKKDNLPEIKDGYYQISSALDLIWASYFVNSGNGNNAINLELTKDIDLKDFNFVPLSYEPTKIFTGEFRGNNYSIYNLTINYNAVKTDKITENIGLFAYSKGNIKNVNIINANINHVGNCESCVGVVVGINTGTILNVVANGIITATLTNSKEVEYIGGIAGKNSNVISECVSQVSGNETFGKQNNTYERYLGQIAGINQANIDNCFAIVNENSTNYINIIGKGNEVSNYFVKQNKTANEENFTANEKWNTLSYINDGLPYLKNTGILNVNFINTSPKEKVGKIVDRAIFNGTNNIAGINDESKKDKLVSKGFFILDNYSNLYNTLLKDIFTSEEYKYSGYSFNGYSSSLDLITTEALRVASSSVFEENLDTINLFKNNSTYYAVWSPNTYQIKLNNKDLTFDVKFANSLNFEDIFKQIYYEYKTEMNENSQDIDYFEFTFKNNTYYISRTGNFVEIENGKIKQNTSINGISTFFPYMFDEDITLTPHFFDISYKVYLDANGGEWKNLPDGLIVDQNNRISTKDNGKANDKVLFEGLAISSTATEPKLTELDTNNKDSKYLYLKGHHLAGFSYEGATNLVDIYRFSDIDVLQFSFDNEGTNVTDIYNVHYVVLFAKFEANKYAVTYEAKNKNADEPFGEYVETQLKEQVVTYGQENLIYEGEVPEVPAYNFINYEFTYNNAIYYLDENGYFINEKGKRERVYIEGYGYCQTFSPYYFTNDLHIYCMFERKKLTFEFNNVNGVKLYYEITDYFTKLVKSKNYIESNTKMEIAYLDTIKIDVFVSNATRLNLISVNSENVFSIKDKLNGYYENFKNEYDKQSFLIENIDDSKIMKFETEKLQIVSSSKYNAYEILAKSDGYYLIYDANDLYTFFERFNTQNAKLMNNINLAGYVFSVDEFSGILDGNNFTISGLVILNSEENEYGFIKNLTGQLLNLNFDNITINVNNIKGENENSINLSIVATNNNGTISQVYVLGGNVKISNDISDNKNINYGTISVNNNGVISNSCAEININATITGRTSVITGLVAVNNNLIEKTYYEGNISANNSVVKGIYFENNANVSASYAYYNSTKEIVKKENDDNNSFFITINDVEKLKNVNNTILNFSHNYAEGTNQNGISTYLNAKKIIDGDVYYYLFKLNNKVVFNSTQFDNSNSINLTLTNKKGNNDVSASFETKYLDKLNNEIIAKNVSYVLKNYAEDLTYNFVSTPSSWDKLDIKFFLDDESGFNDEKIEKILESLTLKITINDVVYDNVILKDFYFKYDQNETQFNFDEAVENVLYYLLSKNYLQFKFNDEIKVEVELPAWARFGEDLGVKVNENEKREYRCAKNFTYEFTVNSQTEKLWFYVERGMITLNLSLNKEDLLESEKEYIKFNTEFINQPDFVYNETDETLTISIYPTLQDGVYKYLSPNLTNFLNYDKNGVNYTFKGFFEKNSKGELSGLIYDENLTCCVDLDDDYSLYAKWEAEEYSIMMVYDDTIRYSSYNGFSQTNGYMTKVVKFGDKLTYANGTSKEIPYAKKYQYNFAYKFEGLNIVENGEPVYALTLNDEQNPILFDEYFSRKWTNYSEGTMNYLPKIKLEPVFTEIEFNVVFKAMGTILTRHGEVETQGGYFENDAQSVTLSITISTYLQLKENNFADIEVPYFEHYTFEGYYILLPSSKVLTYSSDYGCFNEKECENLLSNATFYSVYKTTVVNVTIHAKDYNTNNKIPFELINANDVSDYKLNDDEMTFTIEYNTTNFELPSISIKNDEYLFAKYILNDEIYSKNYYWISDTEIYLACEYKVTLNTYGAVPSSGFTQQQENKVYYCYLSTNLDASSKLTLPSLTMENYTLNGFKVDGEYKQGNTLYSANESVNITKPTVVDAVWSGNIVRASLNGNGAKLPASISNFEGLMGYTLIDETHAELDIIHNTNGSVVANAFSTIKLNGKTFENFTVVEEDVDLNSYTFNYDNYSNIQINANFIDNVYKIKIIENDALKETITLNYNEEIVSTFTPSLTENVVYCGLSLQKNYFMQFNLPTNMPYLEADYSSFVEIYNNEITLSVYAFYLSNASVQIEGNANVKILNTTNLNEFSGGEDFGNPASFKLTLENITTLNFTLPSIEVQNELVYATFKGYYGYNENSEYVLMADADGNLTNNFKVKENLTLTMVFEQDAYELILLGDYSNVSSVGSFEQHGSIFVKMVEFNSPVGLLPVLELDNLIFKGFYFSANTENLLSATDIKLSDENGELVEGFENFSIAYINKLNENGVEIVAKYEQNYVTLNLNSNNINLGTVLIARDAQGNLLDYVETANGYSCQVPKGSSVILSALTKQGVNFVEWTQSGEAEIVNALEKETMIINVLEDNTVTANFEYINYEIHYYLNNEELTTITPNSFNIDESVILPTITLDGYEFLGWYKESSFITKITNIETGTNNDVDVYAKVRNKQISVNIYSSIDGYATSETYNISYNAPFDVLNAYNTNKEGYNFVGFFTQQNGLGYAINENSLCIFNDTFNLYAYFKDEISNGLMGSGTQTNPYKISTQNDLINFANLINLNLFNLSSTYYELTNNIEINLSNLIGIGNGVRVGFNANFNGNNFAIYIKGTNFNSNFVLNENGNVETYNGLFGINNGKISNVIVVSDIVLNENYSNDYTQFVGNVCAINNNKISNCIVYAKLTDNTTKGATSGVISAKNYGEQSLNTQISVVSDETNYIEINNNHYYKNSVTKPKISNNAYFINSETDLAWLSIQSQVDYDVYIMNNLNMKGKIFNSINITKNFYGNGYTISNLLVLDDNSFINTINSNCTINKINFENVLLFNFENNISLINENNGEIERIHISGLTNKTLLVNENNGTISNTFSVSNSQFTLVNTNNNLIENSYAYNNNFVLTNVGTLTNVYNINTTNYESAISEIETKFDINTKDSIWITDENCVIYSVKLPVLKGVGNIYVKVSAPSEFVITNSTPSNFIHYAILLKNAENIKLSYNITDNSLNVSSLTLNGTNILRNKINKDIFIDATSLACENELIVELNKELVKVNVKVEDNSCGDIKYNDNLYKELALELEYGTEFNFSAVALNGYRFICWNDSVTTNDRSIVLEQNLNLVASFEKIYIIEIYYNAENVTYSNKHENFEETEYGLKGVFVSNEISNLDDVLPSLVRENYKLQNYTITKMADKITIKATANWELDYINVLINSNANNYEADISSSTQIDGINVVEKNSSTSYLILRNYQATFTLNLTKCYLTRMLINGSDIYSSVDYANFVTSTDPIIIDLSTYTSNDISINFEVYNIEYNTYFATSENYAISFENNYQIYQDADAVDENMRNYIITPKGEEVKFRLIFGEETELDNIQLFSLDGIEIENSINVETIFNETYYSFETNDHAVLVINLKVREFTIKVNYTEGGKISSNFEIQDEEPTSFVIKLNYDESFELYVEIDKGYKLNSVFKVQNGNKTNLDTSSAYAISNVRANFEINFEFKKQNTWLSVDNENKPINFKLAELKGEGTQESPYLISNIKEFLTMAYSVNILNENYSGKIFKVAHKDLTFDFSQYNFLSIGNDTTTFDGTILGNNLTLKGIRIENGANVGVFSELGTNGVLKSINVLGIVKAHSKVASLVGTNNGTILGCSSSVTVAGINQKANENNIVAGICAINNGKIYQTSFTGSVSGVANTMAGLCGVNYGEILNVFNSGKVELTKNNLAEAIYVSGLVGQNMGTLKFGYNSAQVKAVLGANINLKGVAFNTSILSDVYYNSSVLTAEDLGKTSTELKDESNSIYETWDFENIWFFNVQSYDFPKLNTLYEFSGAINFKVNFDSSISTKVLFVTLTNAYGECYELVLSATKPTASIQDLGEGIYTINLRTSYSVSIKGETTTTLELKTDSGVNYPIEITLTKSEDLGYCSSILI